MQVPVRDLTGVEVARIDLNDAVFGVAMRPAVVHQALVRQRANARQGTSDTKTRAEVAGSGRKPWPQKHTGRARAGSRRSPLWRHGGIIFGPHPKDWSQDIPRKMRRLALRCMLSDKQSDGSLVVLKDLALTDGKTKAIANALKALQVEDTALVVTAAADKNVIQSARNLDGVRTLPAPQLNVGDLVKYRYLVMTVDAVRKAEELWARDIDRKRPASTTVEPPPHRAPHGYKPRAEKPKGEAKAGPAEATPEDAAPLEKSSTKPQGGPKPAPQAKAPAEGKARPDKKAESSSKAEGAAQKKPTPKRQTS